MNEPGLIYLKGARIAECALPLPQPVQLGPMRITTRDVVTLRLIAADGTVGEAMAYTRGTALGAMLSKVVQWLIGQSNLPVDAGLAAFLNAHPNARSAFIRATSMVDMAIADMRSRQEELPLYRCRGGSRQQAPVMAVAGYFADSRTPEDIIDEVQRRIDEGYQRIKLMISGHDIAADKTLLEKAVRILPGGIAADAHWLWNSVSEAETPCLKLDDIGLCFIEDPFPPHHYRDFAKLKPLLATQLAGGEDIHDTEALLDLLPHIGTLRLDVTTCGGFDVADLLADAAASVGCAVLPHVHTEIHGQLAGYRSEIQFVESIPSDVGADPTHLILRRHADIRRGVLYVDDQPGTGVEIDWEAAARFASWSEEV